MFKINKIIIMFILIICLFTIISEVFATENVELDTKRKTSVTINFSPNDILAKNVEFKIYKVADVSSDFEFTITDEFKSYPISLENIDQDGWRKLARNFSTIYNT